MQLRQHGFAMRAFSLLMAAILLFGQVPEVALAELMTPAGTSTHDAAVTETEETPAPSLDDVAEPVAAGLAENTTTPSQPSDVLHESPTPSAVAVNSVVTSGPEATAAATPRELSSVVLSSTGQAAQVGEKLTATPRIRRSAWSEVSAPADTALAVWWESAPTAEGPWTALAADGANGNELLIEESLHGSYVRAQATGGTNTVASPALRVVTPNTYDLARVTLSASQGALLTGDTLTANVAAFGVRPPSTESVYGRMLNNVAFTWYAGTTAEGPWESLSLTGAQVVLPQEAAGRWIRVVATSGASTVEAVSSAPVANGATLSGVVQRLERARWKPTLAYSANTTPNVARQLEEELARTGLSGAQVHLRAATFRAIDAHGDVAISTDEATNGQVSWFFVDPERYTGWSLEQNRQADLTFEITNGDEHAEFVTMTTVPWDEARLEALLTQRARDLSLGFASGDSASSITADVNLPTKVGRRFKVSWISDNSAIGVHTSWSSAKGIIARGAADQPVRLTATISVLSGAPATITATKTFDVVVAADATQAEAERARVQALIDEGFTADKLTEMGTRASAPAPLVRDVQLPTSRMLGLDGSVYRVTYASTQPCFEVVGYRGAVNRALPSSPTLPGATQSSEVTLTVVDRTTQAVVATKTVTLQVAGLSFDELAHAADLMDAAEAGYTTALLGNNASANAVTGDLATFQKVWAIADGSLTWARTADTANAGVGIVVVSRPTYDPMGAADQGNRFASSVPELLKHENLRLLARPDYDRAVVVDSFIAHEDYSRYAHAATASPELAHVLARLGTRQVFGRFVIAGELGSVDPLAPDPNVTDPIANRVPDPDTQQYRRASLRLIGQTADGRAVDWISLPELNVLPGTTVAEVTEHAFGAAGFDHVAQGVGTPNYYLDNVIAPDGRVLAYDQETGAFWQLFINGVPSDRYAGQVEITNDMQIVWYYSVWGATVPAAPVIPREDEPHDEVPAEWPGYGSGSGGMVTEGESPTEGGTLSWSADLGVRPAEGTYVSDPLLVDGHVIVAAGAELLFLNPATGAVEKRAPLAAAIDSVARMVYAKGLIIVPVHGGRLQAIAARSGVTVWVSDALGSDQALSTLTVRDGCVLWGTSNGAGQNGVFACADVETGALLWSHPSQAGYYWSGAAAKEAGVVVADGDGNVRLLDPSSGETRASVSLGARVRSSVVATGTSECVVVTADGVLHVLSVTDGLLTQQAAIPFAASSTSTPAVVGNRVVVGGVKHDSAGNTVGQLSIIDLQSRSVTRTITALSDGSPLPGDIKSTPTVRKHADGSLWAYFTCNSAEGALYGVNLVSGAAICLHLPQGAQANYGMSSPIVDARGNVYYVNDSGYLFCVSASSQREPAQDPGANIEAPNAVQSGKTSSPDLALAEPAADTEALPASSQHMIATPKTSESNSGATADTSNGLSAAAAAVADAALGFAVPLIVVSTAVCLALLVLAAALSTGGYLRKNIKILSLLSPRAVQACGFGIALLVLLCTVIARSVVSPEQLMAPVNVPPAANSQLITVSIGHHSSNQIDVALDGIAPAGDEGEAPAPDGAVLQTPEVPEVPASISSEPVKNTVPAPAPVAPEPEPQRTSVTLCIDRSSVGLGVTSRVFEVRVGETVWDVLRRSGVSVDAASTAFGTYVRGIDGLTERDHGPESGWKYAVNGVDANRSCSAWKVADGDVITWRYVLSLDG